MNFSQRMGLKPIQKQVQINSIDNDLRNSLWNIFEIRIYDYFDRDKSILKDNPELYLLCWCLWFNYYKLTISSIPYHAYESYNHFKSKIIGDNPWNEVYEFLENCIDILSNKQQFSIDIQSIQNDFNTILTREFSGYRFIAGQISPITNETEVEELTESLNHTSQMTALNGANIHLTSALRKLSDKLSPDYRNSIKESISAVESVVNAILGSDNGSLGSALNKLKAKITIHPALEGGFKQIYGYTSDGDGIRHALSEASTCDFEDAKYMLVSCSCFINYLIVKAQKAGIKL